MGVWLFCKEITLSDSNILGNTHICWEKDWYHSYISHNLFGSQIMLLIWVHMQGRAMCMRWKHWWCIENEAALLLNHFMWMTSAVDFDILNINPPVWMKVCFFKSDFWWNLLPQYWQGYGRVSECMSRWVERVEERLNTFPHTAQPNVRSWNNGQRGNGFMNGAHFTCQGWIRGGSGTWNLIGPRSTPVLSLTNNINNEYHTLFRLYFLKYTMCL